MAARPRPRGALKATIAAAGIGSAVAAASVPALGFWFARQLVQPGGARIRSELVRVVDVTDTTVTLVGTHTDLLTPYVALTAEGWHVQLGEILNREDVDDTHVRVTRRWESESATRPVVGALADVDAYLHRTSPEPLGGTAFAVDTDIGPLPVWVFAEPESGTGHTWLVHIHGRGADLGEGLRLVDGIDGAYPSVAMSYRGDDTAPHPPDGVGRFGASEWQDVDAVLAWVVHNLDPGARFVLVGYSQGASLALFTTNGSALRDRIDGLVFDSPLLSLEQALAAGATARGIVGPFGRAVSSVTRRMAAASGSIDMHSLEHVERPPGAPTLVLHGTDDIVVPISGSRTWAEAYPESVQLVEFGGAAHVRAYNVAPDRYVREVLDFLAKLHEPTGAHPSEDNAV